MSRTLYSAEDGAFVGTLGGPSIDADVLDALGYRSVPGQRSEDTYLELDTGHVRKRREFRPSIGTGKIGRLPAGTRIERDNVAIHRLAKAGTARLGADHPETVTVELRHPRYRPKTVTVDCRAGAKGDVRLEQDFEHLRARRYATLREQCGAFQKILKVILPTLPPDVLAQIDPDALAVLASVDAVKAALPKPIKE